MTLAQANNQTKVCRECGTELNEENWNPSRRKYHNYICIVCLAKQYQDIKALTPEQLEAKRQAKIDKKNNPRCTECDVLLTEENWGKSERRPTSKNSTGHHMCKDCRNAVFRPYGRKYYQLPEYREKKANYRNEHADETALYRTEYRKLQKEYAMRLVLDANGKPTDVVQCSVDGCGCTDMRLMELHFKNGGHYRLAKAGKMPSVKTVYQDIIGGRLDPSLFATVCRPHNSIAHLEPILGSVFEIKYIGPKIFAASGLKIPKKWPKLKGK